MRLHHRLFAAFGGARRRAAGSGPPLSPVADPRPPLGRALLALPDFRRLWIVGLVVFAVRWLEMLAVGVFVYQQTGSAFAVALMTLLRMVPMAMFGALIGALADRMQRRSALIAVVMSMLAISICLAGLAYAGQLAVWHLAVASFLNGVAWAADSPVRRVMIGEVAGSEAMAAAMAIDVGANNASRMLGPTVGGLLLAGSGIAGALTVSIACYAIALIAALRLRHRNLVSPGMTGAVLTRVIEGLIAVRHDRRLVGILTITVIYNLFGWPATAMIPVIGQDNLGLGASGIGLLASMEGIGAFAGSIAMALYARPAQYMRLYIGAVMIYLVMLIAFVLVSDPLLAGGALMVAGLSNAAFSVMQATLIYLSAPVDMRSRMYGVLSVCIGVAPLGFLHIGLLADIIGAPWAVTASALEGVVALALTRRWWRDLGAASS